MARNIYKKAQPHLFDRLISELEDSLYANLTWLNNVYGRCERLVKVVDGRNFYSANWYKKGNDYVLLAPDEGLGNFAFFTLSEPTNLETYYQGDNTYCKTDFNLIVWVDVRTINQYRDTEAIKEEILKVLNGKTHSRMGRFYINRIWERAENVFRDFDYEEIDNQFLMHPFAGFRFEGEMEIQTECVIPTSI